MKKFSSIIIAMFALVISLSSCLKSNLDDLKLYDGCDITGVNGAQYRYISDEVSNASGQNIVKYVTLSVSETNIDADAGTVSFAIGKPSNFPETQLNDLSLNNIVVIMNISTAAICTPINNAPAFGVPGDWSKANQYNIKAADGTTKMWTVTVTKLTK